MPLRTTFYLETAKPTTVDTVWDEKEGRFRVVSLTGGGRPVEELQKHAAEAGLVPGGIFPAPYDHGESSDQMAWTLLRGYDGFTDELKAGIDTAFAGIFDSLVIEQTSKVGSHRTWGNIRLFMTKPDGTHTKAWVWNDNLVWIQVAH